MENTMNIADNILKHHLRNVLFVSGTAYGGKTTMTKLIEEKYGFLRYRESTKFDEHLTYANKHYQPAMCYQRRDWQSFFNRPAEEYAKWLKDGLAEQAEMAIIDLIKLSQNQRVIADVHIPLEYLKRIAEYHQVVLLIAEPEMIVESFFNREDKQDMYECIMSTPHPQETLENVKNALKAAATPLEEFYKSGFKCIIRDDDRSIEQTFREIEKHFHLG
jgi:adenylate kinase family enzyme